MPSSSSRKGSTAEREVVKIAQAHGMPAQRAYGSDGRALGEASTVDIMVGEYRVQVKRRAKIAEYVFPPPGADVTAIREDRGDWHIVMTLEEFLKLIGSYTE